ncbi:HTH-type transcriptional repressor YvoA [Tritonibacter multivorans]|uniref:HTH-type transcriptional repressor YvoA n=2 Tax=Tritonibacter multivorans TaxID=928856 RepID=A0A0P1GT67_9RHOB|nr:HTH-type transcriptional repressor YvoA [Tritonibacter multivorans]SFD12058.1 transcriptional regulator, GntR family [Tritonibacter multivorans]
MDKDSNTDPAAVEAGLDTRQQESLHSGVQGGIQGAPTALPIYMQISEFLIREIAAGRLVDGERLPPERELAKSHGTTVRTLRKALSELEKKGLLERVQGSGNYVRASTAPESIYAMFRLELTTGGGLPTADILSAAEAAKPSDLPNFGTSDRGFRFRRLRYLNRVPIAVEEIWLDCDAGSLDLGDMSDSLYRSYQLQLGLRILRAEDRVGIGSVPEWAPNTFGKAPHAPVGYIERFSWADGPVPVEFSRTWYDTDKALYVQRLI